MSFSCFSFERLFDAQVAHSHEVSIAASVCLSAPVHDKTSFGDHPLAGPGTFGKRHWLLSASTRMKDTCVITREPAPQLEPRAQGGFAELEFPLSRIFNAEPTGRNAGWTATLHYGYDGVWARDVRRVAPAGGRGISTVGFGNLQYKMNSFVTLGYELSYYRTRAVAGAEAPFPPLFKGVPSHNWHDLRSEFATIFTF